MLPTGGAVSGGAAELSRGGLARFRSAPATWLEALLESEEEDVVLDPLKPIPQLPPSGRVNNPPVVDPELFVSANAAFLRQNSSPAEFLSQISSSGVDTYFSNFGIPANFDYISPSLDVSGSSKRSRAIDSSQMKEEQIGNLHGGTSGSLDADMEKLLEDSVPCRIRAKRGCATHPRSVAERVRRTRISDRIRKLQELLPNMDKQTNTADMLEEAVDYVRFLQKQIQELTEHQKNCKCATDQKQ